LWFGRLNVCVWNAFMLTCVAKEMMSFRREKFVSHIIWGLAGILKASKGTRMCWEWGRKWFTCGLGWVLGMKWIGRLSYSRMSEGSSSSHHCQLNNADLLKEQILWTNWPAFINFQVPAFLSLSLFSFQVRVQDELYEQESLIAERVFIVSHLWWWSRLNKYRLSYIVSITV